MLIVSAIGYESKEVAIGSSSSNAVKLAIDTKAIGEVVVTGTGTATSKKRLSFAVESISADTLPVLLPLMSEAL
ncbi:MAG: hypothetical protein ACXWWC_13510 [Chitinophagaceae bacterium]